MNGKKLYFPALNAFRLMAIMAIVIGHMLDFPYFFEGEGPQCFHLWANFAMPFFFLLSGFLMAQTEVPQQVTVGFIGKIAWHKFCRFYPLHILITVASIWAIPLAFDWKPFLAAATLTQSLSTDIAVYYSYNAVSWYLSSVFILFLLYPYMARHAWIFLTVSAVATVWLSMVVPDRLSEAILHINPFFNIFKFVVGMLLFRLVKSILDRHPALRTPPGWRERLIWTTLELLTILALAYWYLHLYGSITSMIAGRWQITGLTCLSWRENGIVPILPIFVVFAIGRGWISWLFSARLITVLSKYSLAYFLIHVLCGRVISRFDLLGWCPASARLAAYALLTLAICMVLHYAYEKPAAAGLERLWGSARTIAFMRRWTLPAVLLLAFGLYVASIFPRPTVIDNLTPKLTCDNVIPNQVTLYNNNCYTLHPGEKPTRATYALDGVAVDDVLLRVKTVSDRADVIVNFYLDGQWFKHCRLKGVQQTDIQLNLFNKRELVIESDKNGVLDCDCVIVENVVFHSYAK